MATSLANVAFIVVVVVLLLGFFLIPGRPLRIIRMRGPWPSGSFADSRKREPPDDDDEEAGG